MDDIIQRKRNGKALRREEIVRAVAGFTAGDVPEHDMADLLKAIYAHGMNGEELAHLTGAMIASGDRIAFPGLEEKLIDKHSTGGVGDKISLVVAPLVAACGVGVPMISGRSIGHSGGTLDKLESIPGLRVDLTPAEMARAISESGMAVCSQTAEMVPADGRIYALRDATDTVGSIPLIASSIMSKKLALATDGIVLDVKTGSGAFMREEDDAAELLKTMVDLGESSGRPTVGLVTSMDQPLGRAVGNALEVAEAVEALEGRGPADVMEVTMALGAAMLLLAKPGLDGAEALQELREALDSGRALAAFGKFITAQGGDSRICDDVSILPHSKFQSDFTAGQDGYIASISTTEVGAAANKLFVKSNHSSDMDGARREPRPTSVVPRPGAARQSEGGGSSRTFNHSAGFVFERKVGDRVRKGDVIAVIHASDPAAIEAAGACLAVAVRIAERPPRSVSLIRRCANAAGVYSVSTAGDALAAMSAP